jgi:signal transduction histidine kinase
MIGSAPVMHAERLVCFGRLVLALAALIAVTFDAEPRTLAGTIPLAVAYCVYALLAALVHWRFTLRPVLDRRVSHVIDVGVILVLTFVSSVSTSPFFAFFLFALISASVRFGSKVTLATAAVLFVTYVIVGIQASVAEALTAADQSRFLIRSSYLLVITVLIIYLTRYQERLRGELTQIAAWPPGRANTIEEALQDVLPRAAKLLRAKRLLLLWEVSDEPWIYAAFFEEERIRLEQHSPGEFLPIVDESVGEAVFATRNPAHGRTTIYQQDRALRETAESPTNAAIAAKYGLGATVSAAFAGDIVTGRVFFLDPQELTLDDLTLADIVARLVGRSVEQHFVTSQLQAVAASDERLRVARDLHDGFVQSLAGAALHLHMLERLIDEDPTAARASVRSIAEGINEDQRELRSYIAQLRPSMGTSDKERTLVDLIRAAASRIERERSIDIDLNLDPNVVSISQGMQHETFSIMREAMTNAAKHANPEKITVDLALRGDRVVACVADDGDGFPFHGKFDLATLRELRRGPMTLKERITVLSGNLVIESGPDGSRLHIELPRTLAGVRK